MLSCIPLVDFAAVVYVNAKLILGNLGDPVLCSSSAWQLFVGQQNIYC